MAAEETKTNSKGCNDFPADCENLHDQRDIWRFGSAVFFTLVARPTINGDPKCPKCHE
jgi:hypothetical protein